MRQVKFEQLRTRGALATFILAVAAAVLVPLLGRAGDPAMAASSHFPGWPSHYEGRALMEMALTQREMTFVRGFPGRVGRFSDGEREIIIRWVSAPTRRLHPAADCFRGSGYSVTPMPAKKDAGGTAMGCFRAHDDADRITVCEMIRDDRGASWPDVSAWYWSAMFGASPAPWWSFVVAERE
jgi:hypothetical protein